jgi:hypothetical protein
MTKVREVERLGRNLRNAPVEFVEMRAPARFPVLRARMIQALVKTRRPVRRVRRAVVDDDMGLAVEVAGVGDFELAVVVGRHDQGRLATSFEDGHERDEMANGCRRLDLRVTDFIEQK